MKNSTKLILLSSLLFVLNTHSASNENEITIPFSYAKGQVLYESSCASCHGKQLTGTDKGPPFLHRFYKPSHHGDQTFYRAALLGVKAHHWGFGDMPSVLGMTKVKLKSIVSYIRYYQQHKNLF
ncbi:MAG: cytochrome c5 [Urechidicola sp.]|jgi:cytochrome c5